MSTETNSVSKCMCSGLDCKNVFHAFLTSCMQKPHWLVGPVHPWGRGKQPHQAVNSCPSLPITFPLPAMPRVLRNHIKPTQEPARIGSGWKIKTGQKRSKNHQILWLPPPPAESLGQQGDKSLQACPLASRWRLGCVCDVAWMSSNLLSCIQQHSDDICCRLKACTASEKPTSSLAPQCFVAYLIP